jgi:hypothetical protein
MVDNVTLTVLHFKSQMCTIWGNIYWCPHHMETFAELLSYHIKRVGISDTELARTVGVSRQTIFRWREGLTGRPNGREDVLAIAEKLHLSSEERDTLLLVAGFRPDNIAPLDNGDAGMQSANGEKSNVLNGDKVETEIERSKEEVVVKGKTSKSSGLRHNRTRWLAVTVICVLLVAVLVTWLVAGSGSDRENGNTADAGDGLNLSDQSGSEMVAIVPAAPGEVLVVVTQFVDAGSQQFAQKLVDALQREVSANRIPDVRVAIGPETVEESDQAIQLSQKTGATLVVYGEGDADQVVIEFIPPIPSRELLIDIDDNLIVKIRPLALLVLGHMSVNQDNIDQSITLLVQARNVLEGNVEEDDRMLTTINAILLEAYETGHQTE